MSAFRYRKDFARVQGIRAGSQNIMIKYKQLIQGTLIVISACVSLAGCSHESNPKAHTVVVIVEAKPGHDVDLKQALHDIIMPSRNEKASIEYKVHQSDSDPNQFMLYETWTSAQEHAKQFEKHYILKFADQLKAHVAKPYVLFMGKEIS